MPTFELEALDRKKYRIEADTPELAKQAFDHAFGASASEPPPGVIVHDKDRSYVTGGGPQVSTKGMQPGIGMEAERAQLAKQPDRSYEGFLNEYMLPGAGGGPRRIDPGAPSNRGEAAAALQLRQQGLPGGGVVAPIMQGLTSAYGDEATSLGFGAAQASSGAPFGEAYNVMQEAQRQDRAQQQEEHPYRTPVLQAGGALANLPGLAAAGLPNFVARAGTPLIGRTAGGAGTGAAYGAVEGFGSGSGLRDRLQNSVIGAGSGLLVGGAIPVAGDLVRRGINRGLDYRTVNRNLGEMGVGRPAGDLVMRQLEADDAFNAGRAAIGQAGEHGMLADVGPTTRGLLDAAITQGGGGSGIVREAVRDRSEQAHRSLTDVFDRNLGAPRSIEDLVTDIRVSGQPARRTAYDLAYDTPIDYSTARARDLEELFTRIPNRAVAEANEAMQIGGHRSRQIRYTIDDQGNAVFERLPDVRQIDYLTRGLRAAADKEQAGHLGGMTDSARRLTNLAGNIRRTTRQLVPEYGQALDTAADDIGRVQASRLGNDLLGKMTRGELAEQLRNHTASAAEMQAVRNGVRGAVDDIMARTNAAMNDVNQDAREVAKLLQNFNTRETQDKLRLVLDPLQHADVARTIQEATMAMQLRAAVAENSKTAGRQALAQAGKELLTPGVFGQMARAHPLQAGQRLTQELTGRTPAFDLGRQDTMNRQVAELLTGTRGTAAQDNLDRLRRAYATVPQNAATAQQTGGLAGYLAGIPGYQELVRLMGGQ